MARTPILPLRVDDETKQRWQAAARDQGLQLSEFIRDAVEQAIVGPQVARAVKREIETALLTKGAKLKRVVPGECPRAHFHRSGTFCKACGVGIP